MDKNIPFNTVIALTHAMECAQVWKAKINRHTSDKVSAILQGQARGIENTLIYAIRLVPSNTRGSDAPDSANGVDCLLVTRCFPGESTK